MRHFINIGCGPCKMGSHSKAHWTNIDIEKSHNPDAVVDCRHLHLVYMRDYFDGMISIHMLEHINFPDGVLQALVSMHEVLKPDGILRLVVPDLMKIARKYVAGEDLKDVYDGPFHEGPDFPATRFQYFCRGWQHTVLFDEQLLRHFLERAGFREITVMPFSVSRDPELCGHDRFFSESLVLESIK